jgi:hypothetical protein
MPSSVADRHRAQAKVARDLADICKADDAKEVLLKIAREYEGLAAEEESRARAQEGSSSVPSPSAGEASEVSRLER